MVGDTGGGSAGVGGAGAGAGAGSTAAVGFGSNGSNTDVSVGGVEAGGSMKVTKACSDVAGAASRRGTTGGRAAPDASAGGAGWLGVGGASVAGRADTAGLPDGAKAANGLDVAGSSGSLDTDAVSGCGESGSGGAAGRTVI
jgi:hypothetical protein